MRPIKQDPACVSINKNAFDHFLLEEFSHLDIRKRGKECPIVPEPIVLIAWAAQCAPLFHGHWPLSTRLQRKGPSRRYSRVFPGRGWPSALPAAASRAIFVASPTAAERWIISCSLSCLLLAFTCAFDKISDRDLSLKQIFGSFNAQIDLLRALHAGNA